MCLRTFLPCLSLTYRRELERIRCTTAAVTGGADELTWEMIVHDARARHNTMTVVPEEARTAIGGFAPPREQFPPHGTAAMEHETRAHICGDVASILTPREKWT